MTRSLSVGISYMYEPAFNKAILPLLESGDIDALEWSFDTVTDHRDLPGWMQGLLRTYSEEGRLYGHGVYYSLLTGSWGQRQEAWMERVRQVCDDYSFRHISEHFGFMTSRNAHSGAPLPVPFTEEILSLGIARLCALQATTSALVGVENLALSLSLAEALSHGDFLRRLVTPVGGFIVLDLHNAYCQSVNFDVPLLELIASYPLEHVKELHLSGGSWAGAPGRVGPVRRDTHDDAIPEALMDILPDVIYRCPNLDVIFVERLGDTILSDAAAAEFREEFLRVKKIVDDAAPRPVPDWPFEAIPLPAAPLHYAQLANAQQVILGVLRGAATAHEAKYQLVHHPALTSGAWRPEEWDVAMLDTAMQLGKKWGIDLEDGE